MAWSRPGDKPLSEPMMVSLLTHICVTRPQWVKCIGCLVFVHAQVYAYGPKRHLPRGMARAFLIILTEPGPCRNLEINFGYIDRNFAEVCHPRFVLIITRHWFWKWLGVKKTTKLKHVTIQLNDILGLSEWFRKQWNWSSKRSSNLWINQHIAFTIKYLQQR